MAKDMLRSVEIFVLFLKRTLASGRDQHAGQVATLIFFIPGSLQDSPIRSSLHFCQCQRLEFVLL